MKYFKYILTLGVIVAIVWFAKSNPNVWEASKPADQEKRELCYIWNTEAGDSATLRMTFIGQGGRDVTGSFAFLPAEKDSKHGSLVGTAGPLDQMTMSRTANLWWTASGEGVTNTEELIVKFGDGTAVVGFGEMKDRGDGVYVYANPSQIYYGPNLSQTDCGDSAVN